MIRNLGQVAAIYIGSSQPTNTNLIWLDNTVVPYAFRAYDGSTWSELATRDWVKMFVDGWLVSLPPSTQAGDTDYLLINSNNVNYKITVKEFVKSAVGNPLDFKGVIRTDADFPNPANCEAGDMYVIITSPAGGTVTDPYSGQVFEDTEKIVWDEVTKSWASLGKIEINVDLSTDYSATNVTINSSAGKGTTINAASTSLAGVMLPQQVKFLAYLSNGSTVPGEPSELDPDTPAHKHNYGDILNRLISQQEMGDSTYHPMSQKVTTDNLNLKFDKANVVQVQGAATDMVMSQKAVTDALKTLSDDFNNKLTNYLPLAGGTMKGNIRFPIGNGIVCNDVTGTAAYVVLRTWNANNSTRMYVGTVNFPTYISSTASDLIHDRNGSSYLLWDSYNLPTPASTTDLANYLPLVGGTLTGQLTIKQEVDIKLRLQSTDADNHCIIQAINSQASQLGVFGYAGDKWAIGHGGTYYEIWDKYNLTNPVTYTTDTYNYATLRNKDGQYFTYIKAGTNGLLPHSKATLVSGGSGFLGTSDQSFNAGYINNLHTNKVTFGVNGPYIIGGTSATQFLDANGGVQKVATGGLYVGVSYASDALNLVPTGGIYSRGAIKSYTGFTSDFRISNLTIARTGNDVLHISSFANDPENMPGIDPISSQVINDGVALTYFWQGDYAFQLVGDIDGTGMAYRRYTPSTGASGTWKFLADTSWVVSKINSSTSNYLPLTGGTLTGNLTINTAGSTTFVINNNDINGSETFMRVLRKGIASAAIGFRDSLGAYIYNYNSKKYLFIDNDGYARVGTTSGSTRLALITDIPTVSGYLPLSGGTLTGALTMSGRRNNIVVDVIGGVGNNWDEGAGALSVQVPNDNGQTPLILARRSGAAINTTVATERLLSMELSDTGHTFIIGMSGSEALQLDWTSGKAGTGKLFGKTIASTTDLANYLPLVGGTLTGQLTIKQEVDIKLRLQSTDADNHCIIQAINSQASQLGVFGYAGDKWAIGHGGTYYEIWDKYNLTNPVTYTTDTYNYATLRNKDGQYFTYIKAGTNGLLPHSKATLVSGGSGFLGTSDQSFNAGYINNLHTNKVTFGVNGPYIIGGTSATQFLDANGGVQKVATGGLYVGVSYASDALNLVPTGGIYSRGAIKSYTGFTSDFRISNLTIARTGNDVLHISSFANDPENMPGIDPISSQVINDGVALTYFWQGDYAFQLVGDIDGTGMAYRRYTPSTGASGTWKFLADTSWVVSKINSSTSNYLPLTGGTLTGNLTINTAGSTTFVINNNDINGSETFMRVLRKGIASAAIGFRDSLGAYIYNYNSKKYLFIDNDGYARVGTTSGSTRLALITDIPTVSGYLPLSGGTLTGALTMSGRRNNIVVDVIGGVGNNWDEGAGALSVQVPNDNGQTPLILARRSGAAINTTVATERLLSMELSDTGHTFIIGMSGSEALQLDWTSGKAGTGKLFGKTIATTDQIPSIPSISISNSGSGNAVTAISASGHTLTVTKGATYLTSSSLSGYATQSWVTSQGYLTSSSLSGYATQEWVNSQNFVKSTSTKKVTDIQPVDALPATQASGVLYLVFG